MSEFPCFRKTEKGVVIEYKSADDFGEVIFVPENYDGFSFVGATVSAKYDSVIFSPCEDPRAPQFPAFRKTTCSYGKEFIVMFRNHTSGMVVMAEDGCTHRIWTDRTDWIDFNNPRWKPCEDPRPAVDQDLKADQSEKPKFKPRKLSKELQHYVDWPSECPHWITSDGEVFKSKAEAIHHQDSIDLMDKFIDACCVREGMMIENRRIFFKEDLEAFTKFIDSVISLHID